MLELPTFADVGRKDNNVGAGFDSGSMTNSAAPELPPPGDGFITLNAAEPAFVMSAVVIWTCSCVLEVYVVVRAVLFQRTLDPEMKLYPVIVTVNALPPWLAELGLNEVITGTAFCGGGGGFPPPPEPPELPDPQPARN